MERFPRRRRCSPRSARFCLLQFSEARDAAAGPHVRNGGCGRLSERRPAGVLSNVSCLQGRRWESAPQKEVKVDLLPAPPTAPLPERFPGFHRVLPPGRVTGEEPGACFRDSKWPA